MYIHISKSNRVFNRCRLRGPPLKSSQLIKGKLHHAGFPSIEQREAETE